MLVVVTCAAVDVAALATWLSTSAENAGLARMASGESGLDQLKAAVRYRPDRVGPRLVLAQQECIADPQEGLDEARLAVRLAPYDWEAWHTLGVIQFQNGLSEQAWDSFQRGMAFNRGFESHYQAANLALVLGREGYFWSEMRSALAIAPLNEIPSALSVLLSRAGNNKRNVLDAMSGMQAEAAGMAVNLLLERGDPGLALLEWGRITECQAELRPACGMISRKLANGLMQDAFLHPAAATSGSEVESAINMWDRAVKKGWLQARTATLGYSADPAFDAEWNGPAFAWARSSPSLGHRNLGDTYGRGHLIFSLADNHAEKFELVHQLVAVRPGTRYSILSSLRTEGPGTGQGMEIVVIAGATTVAQIPVSVDAGTMNRALFTTGPNDHVVRLSLNYERPIGQPEIRQDIEVDRVQLVPADSNKALDAAE